jgi:hypothetical protein
MASGVAVIAQKLLDAILQIMRRFITDTRSL